MTLPIPFVRRTTAATWAALAVVALTAPSLQAAETVEVIHWWTSAGETAAVGKFKEAATAKGVEWKDLAVGGADNQRTLLKTRVGKGSPPDAAQINSDVRAYAADRNNLANLTDLAAKDKWDSVLPPVVQRYAKFNGSSYVAVPVNVHRQNVMWLSTEALKKIGGTAPKTWEEFYALADKAKAAGIMPLVMATDNWVNFMFLQVAFSTLQPEAYRKAFYDLDDAALKGPGMAKAFEVMRKLRGYTDRSASTRKWNEGTQLVIQGKALAQVMGDWAKGEFTLAGKKPGVDYLCQPVPGSGTAHQFNSDAFMFFKHGSDSPGQLKLAQILMDKTAQENFSLAKGSVPVRNDADVSKFDDCAKASYTDFVAGGKNGSLTAAPQMFQTAARMAAFSDIVLAHWNDEGMSPQQAADKMAAAAKAN